MFGFLFSCFIGTKISCTNIQTLPNLRLPISSDTHSPGDPFLLPGSSGVSGRDMGMPRPGMEDDAKPSGFSCCLLAARYT